MGEGLRKSGIDVIGDIPWGTHLYQFYLTKEDLVETLVPYFKEGLENNEFCMWVTSEPLNVEDAKTSLKKVVKNLNDYVERGQIEILDYSQWYTKSGRFEPDKVLQGWVEKERQAVKKGFDGVRLTGNTFWVETKYWKEFADYEAEVNRVIGQHRMIALCSYPIDRYGAAEVIDVIGNHKFGLIRREGKWEVIESAERKRLEKELRESEEKFRGIAERSFDVIFMMDPEGRFTYVSPSVERTGYRPGELVGKPFQSLLPELDVPKAVQTLNKLMKGEVIEGLELDVLKKDGSLATIEINASPILKDGKVVGAQGIIRSITERKEAEKRVRESEDKLRGVFSTIIDGMTLVGLDGRILDCNDAVLRLHNVSRDEYIGKNVYDFIAPEDRQRAIQEATVVLEKGVLLSEVKALRKKGGFFDAEINVSLLKGASGEPKAFLGVTRDITKRKKAEEALRESEAKFERLFISSPGAVVYVDPNFHVLNVNSRFEELFGYSLDEIKGKHIDDTVVPKNRMKEAKMLDEKAKEGYICLDTVRRKRDGTLVPVSVSAAPVIVEDQLIGYVGLYMDISEREKMENVLKESKRHFQTLFNFIVDPVVVVGKKGKILEVTDRVEEVTGYNKEEIYGKNFARTNFLTVESRAIVMKNFARRLKGMDIAPYEIEIFTKDRRKIPVEINASKIDYMGETAVMAVFRDVTERKRMEEELRKHTEHLEELVKEKTQELRDAERLAAIGETAAMVGHDLRNPLQSIVNATYLARENLKSVPSPPAEKQGVKELLGTIEKETEYMDKIVSDLQDYARPLEPKLHRTSLRQLIDDVLSSMRVPENVEVSVETDIVSIVTEEDLKLMVDPMLMRRVFTNLITNALQAMPNGGRLTIRASKTEDAVLIMMEDTGVGIPKEFMSKLFQPLFTIKAKGMGLGLAVCKRLVEAHGGTITVESKVGRGTTVTVKIPL